MKKHIAFIIVLMAVCVVSVIGLQLFWNFQNYKSTVKNFDHDINEALRVAVDREMDVRHKAMVKQVTRWMQDTSFITVTCNIKNRTKQTAFTVKDRNPLEKDRGFSMSINTFKPKLTSITPEARQYFIKYFANRIVYRDLKKGIIYYYTQRLGDSLEHAFFISKLNMVQLRKFYTEELHSRGIQSAFTLNKASKIGQQPYVTRATNASLRRPYEQELVKAGFESPALYFVREMKWVVLGTLLLMTVIVICFGYTTRTLLSQHKLAELKNNFIHNMTHELNTPLASIQITVEALNTFNHDPERLKEYLNIIGYQTHKLTTLTHQILNTHKLAKPNKQTWQQVNLNSLIQETINAFTPQIEAGGFELIFQDEVKEVMVRGEQAALSSIFGNMIDNALKYNNTNPPVLKIGLNKNQRYAEVVFADNGPGISPEFHQQVFEPFFRVPKGDTHDVKGYGLGLSYVKQVVEMHKGSIVLSNNEPHGCIFTIRLPLA